MVSVMLSKDSSLFIFTFLEENIFSWPGLLSGGALMECRHLIISNWSEYCVIFEVSARLLRLCDTIHGKRSPEEFFFCTKPLGTEHG
jgi:hypothetical protein